MNSLRIGLIGLVGAFAGFALQGCFAAQPQPECQVTTASAAFGIGPYHVALKKIDGTGPCSNLEYINVGMQRFRVPDSTSFSVGLKPSVLVDPYQGFVYAADYDDSNNCASEEDCDTCADAMLPDGGDNPAFPCMYVDDPVYRVDPTDPDGEKQVGYGTMSQFPTNGVCSVNFADPIVQNFQEEVLDLADGGMETLPAVPTSVTWTDFQVLATTKAPGTVWTAKMQYKEGNCTANYDAFAFWPEIHCAEDADCNPEADLDAGRVFGSGISPAFKPTCDTSKHICVPTVTVDDLKK